MKKRTILLNLALLIGVCFLVSSARGALYGGGGTAELPYLIYTPEEMNDIGNNAGDWDKHFKLMADIDLSGYTGTAFNLIGTDSTAFTGVFDGNDHTISNFTYECEHLDYIGLFRKVSGQIKDLGLISPYVRIQVPFNDNDGFVQFTGAMVGQMSGTMSGCYVKNGQVSGGQMVGGLVGFMTGGTISWCRVEGGTVSGIHTGGLIGAATNPVTNSYSTADVSAPWGGGGGLIGATWGWVTVSGCFATGNVNGSQRLGGLIGHTQQTTIIDCYAAGDLSGGNSLGGLLGLDMGETSISRCYSTGVVPALEGYNGGLVGYENIWGVPVVQDSFWDVNTCGLDTSFGGIALTTEQMYMQSSFTNWDFDNVWYIREGEHYPLLQWQMLAADIDGSGCVNFIDYAILISQWSPLPLGVPSADIAPPGGDGIVDINDLDLLTESWLLGCLEEPTPEPIAHWQFDEGDGDIAYDSAGSNHGSLQGDPNWVSGQIGGGLDFDGDGDYVQIPDADSLTPSYELTISFWFYNRGGQTAGIYKTASCPSENNSPGNSRAYYLQVGEGVGLRIFSSENNYDSLSSIGGVSLNGWHHIAATFDTGQAAIYIDGQPDNSGTLSVSSIANDAQPLIIGGFWNYCGTDSFVSRLNGKMDDVRIYDRALTAGQILDLYQAGL